MFLVPEKETLNPCDSSSFRSSFATLGDELPRSPESFRMGAGLRPLKGPIKGLELRAMRGQPDLPENSGTQSSIEFSGW